MLVHDLGVFALAIGSGLLGDAVAGRCRYTNGNRLHYLPRPEPLGVMLRHMVVRIGAMLAAVALSACSASHASSAWYPDEKPVIVSAKSVAPSSHPPGAVVSDIGPCPPDKETASTSATVEVPTDWRNRAQITTANGERLNVVAPAAFLPLRLAHMPDFAPKMCVIAVDRHDRWVRVGLFIEKADTGSLATAYGPVQWSGRPLVTLNLRR